MKSTCALLLLLSVSIPVVGGCAGESDSQVITTGGSPEEVQARVDAEAARLKKLHSASEES